jgi:spore maturation protein CgeB
MLTGKRLVFASEFHSGGTARGLAHGFRALGWAVQEVDTRQSFPHLPNRAARLLLKPLQGQLRAGYNQSTLEAATRDQPQIFLTVKGSYIAADTLHALRARGIKTVNYYPDRDFDRPDIEAASLDAYDLFITTKPYQVDALTQRLGAARVGMVHHGHCDMTHVPAREPVSPAFDVLYVGNYSQEKQRWLGQLARLLPDVDIRIVGFAWDRNTDPVLRPRIHGHGYHGDNYARVLQQARIVISLHGDRKEPEGWQDMVSTRTFEIPACKAFMLHIDSEEVRTLFEPETEIGVFSTAEELAKGVRRYLADPALRAAMIEKAFNRCTPAYGYAARARSVEALIQERLNPTF